MRVVYLFDVPDRFVVGTVGMPGERTFFLQARQGARIVSVALEKDQVSILAERMNDLLVQVERIDSEQSRWNGPADLEPLDNPIAEEFRVGVLSLGWNSSHRLVVLEAHAMSEQYDDVPDLEEDDSEGPDVLRVRMTGSYARGFISRAIAVVAAGRPPCPFCELPLDARGHICPRANGYRRMG